jgi:hypothetical protein
MTQREKALQEALEKIAAETGGIFLGDGCSPYRARKLHDIARAALATPPRQVERLRFGARGRETGERLRFSVSLDPVEFESRSEIERFLGMLEDAMHYDVIEVYTYRGEEPGHG